MLILSVKLWAALCCIAVRLQQMVDLLSSADSPHCCLQSSEETWWAGFLPLELFLNDIWRVKRIQTGFIKNVPINLSLEALINPSLLQTWNICVTVRLELLIEDLWQLISNTKTWVIRYCKILKVMLTKTVNTFVKLVISLLIWPLKTMVSL